MAEAPNDTVPNIVTATYNAGTQVTVTPKAKDGDKEFKGWIVQIVIMAQVLFVIISAIVALTTFSSDQKRRRYQATLDIYTQISEKMNEKTIVDFTGEKIDPDSSYYKDNKATIKRILSLYEMISVGINQKILDLEVFVQLAGVIAIEWYEKLEPVIKRIREDKKQDTWYSDFEKLVNEIKMRKKQSSKKTGSN